MGVAKCLITGFWEGKGVMRNTGVKERGGYKRGPESVARAVHREKKSFKTGYQGPHPTFRISEALIHIRPPCGGTSSTKGDFKPIRGKNRYKEDEEPVEKDNRLEINLTTPQEGFKDFVVYLPGRRKNRSTDDR